MKKISLNNLKTTPTSHNQIILKKVIAKSGEIPHITQIAQATLNPGDVVGIHKHDDMYEVFYVEKGECEVMINGQTHHLSTGDVVTTDPGDTHEFANHSTQHLTMFYFGIKL